MAKLKVTSPGFLTTVQDLGRFGHAHSGISPAGAADPVALRFGNLLVGNPEECPALEMTLVGGTFEFESYAVIAITGSNFNPHVDSNPVPPWTSLELKPGQKLRCGPTVDGARCFLCIRGGLDVEPLLGSASTHYLTGLGGFQGRALKEGDVLVYHASRFDDTITQKRLGEEIASRFRFRNLLRVTRAPQHDLFSANAREIFSGSTYKVSEESNRVGLRLTGPPLNRLQSGDILTEGVSLGAIQVPDNGQPIILFVEQPTTGGYPKIANVISADLHAVGQLKPRDEVHFEFITLERAITLLQAQERYIGLHSLIPA